MPAVKFDPTKPIVVSVTFHSPHVVAYRLWYKRPGDTAYTVFATGTDSEPSNPSSHAHMVSSLPAGSDIVYLAWLSGNDSTPYRIEVSLMQNDQAVADGYFVLQGTTDGDGFAQEKDTISLTV